MEATILIVDDEKHTRQGLEQALEDTYEVYLAANAEEAFTLMESEAFDIVLTDLRMTGKSGLKVIEKALRLPRQPICIMMTAYGNVDAAVAAMKQGAFDFLTKPINLEKLKIILQRALKSQQVKQENVQLHQRLDRKYQFGGIIGSSPQLEGVLEKARLVAPSKATVLITGQTGTGKELIAQSIHQNSDRNHGPFVPVHCAALSANLLESELFGHERGAFTGTTGRRIGRFEAADGGTLFLDEIGDIDAATQVKLLRFLETKTLERLGSNQPISVDVRLICATNRNLEIEVKKGNFREDLFYRLNVINIHLPSLHERSEDIGPLLRHYIQHFSKENNTPPTNLSVDALRILQHYPWPGNIRELRNFCENIVVMKRGGEITPYDLDPKFIADESLPQGPRSLLNNPLSVEENEKRLLRNALAKAQGNRTKAAELMGISRRTLHRKLRQWPKLDVRTKESSR